MTPTTNNNGHYAEMERERKEVCVCDAKKIDSLWSTIESLFVLCNLSSSPRLFSTLEINVLKRTKNQCQKTLFPLLFANLCMTE
jgi:hypothetical protein